MAITVLGGLSMECLSVLVPGITGTGGTVGMMEMIGAMAGDAGTGAAAGTATETGMVEAAGMNEALIVAFPADGTVVANSMANAVFTLVASTAADVGN